MVFLEVSTSLILLILLLLMLLLMLVSFISLSDRCAAVVFERVVVTVVVVSVLVIKIGWPSLITRTEAVFFGVV